MKIKKINYFLLTKSVGQYLNFLSIFSPIKASEKAFELFSQPRKGKLKTDEIPEFLKKTRFETLKTEFYDIQTYIWEGSEKIILLVHGWESNSGRWEKIIPFLIKTGHTIIAIDAPAHGLSSGIEFTVPKYANAILELTKKYNPNYIIGHSIGGAATIYYQYLNQNSNLEKLVLLGAPSDLSVLIDNFCKMLSLNNKVKQELEKQFSSRFKMKIKDFSAFEFAKNINTEAFIVHDKKDKVVALTEGEKISKNWINSQFIITENLGHGMQNKKLFAKIVTFLEN